MTVTVIATVELDNVPPRVRLDVTGTTETSTTVLRLNPDGTKVPVRTADGLPLPLSGTGGGGLIVTDNGDGTATTIFVTDNGDGTATTTSVIDNGDGTAGTITPGTGTTGLVYDYEAPYGASLAYSTLESPDVATAQLIVDVPQIWLTHPGVPELSLPVELQAGSLMEEALAVNQGVFYPMGRATPVVVTDSVRKAAQSTLLVITESVDELNSLRALLSDASPLLLNIPVPLGMGFDTAYISVQDVKISRLSDIGADPQRSVTLPFVVVDRPTGGSQAERTYTDLLADWLSYDAARAFYTSYTALLAGP